MSDTDTTTNDDEVKTLGNSTTPAPSNVTNLADRRTTKRADVVPIPKGSTGTKAKASKPVAPTVTKGQGGKRPAKVAEAASKRATAKAAKAPAKRAAKPKAAPKAKAGTPVVRATSVVSKEGSAKCQSCGKTLPVTSFPTARINGEQVRDTRRCRACRDAGKPMPGAKAAKASKATKATKAPARKAAPRKAAAKPKAAASTK